MARGLFFFAALFALQGSVGVDLYFDVNGAGNSWTGNLWDDTAAPVAP